MPKITGSEMPRLIKALETLGFEVSSVEDLQPQLDTGVFVQANEWKQLLKAFERLAEWKHHGELKKGTGLGYLWQYVSSILDDSKTWVFNEQDEWNLSVGEFVQVEGEQDEEMKASFQENFRTLFLIGGYTRLVD